MPTEILELKWSEVAPDPSQPRKTFDADALEALSASFRERGQITPARVRKANGPSAAAYILVDGERRWMVGKKLYEAEPDNPLFSTFRAFVEELPEEDVLVVQFLS